MTTATKYLLSFTPIAIILIVVTLYFMGPVIVSVQEFDSTRAKPALTLFNPFRDVSAEHVADDFLSQLRAGKCDEATADLPAEKAVFVCEKQIEYPLEK